MVCCSKTDRKYAVRTIVYIFCMDSLKLRILMLVAVNSGDNRVKSSLSVTSYLASVMTLLRKKVKAVPLRSIEAHLSDRRYSSYSFLTSALEGGEWSASRPGRALPRGKEPPVPTVQEAGWAPEPVWTQNPSALAPTMHCNS
jgi:hypothetical protein